MKDLVFYVSELQKENTNLRNDITSVKQSFSDELEELKQRYASLDVIE